MHLVTGSSGFVGAAVVRGLLARGEAVRVLMRPTSDRSNIQGLDVEIVEGDLLDPASLAPAVKGCEGVFHVAADYRIWTRNPDAMFRANVDGSVALLRAALEAGVRRSVYTSSVSALGLTPDGTAADETTPVREQDIVGPYKQSKYKAEQAVKAFISETGADVVVVNPSSPFGPRDIKPTPTGRIVVEAASGRMPAYVDTGLNVVHVEDVANGHLLAFDNGKTGESYILGSENMALSEILGVICGLAGRPAPKVKLPTGLVMPIAYVAEAWCRLTGGEEPMVSPDSVRMARKKMYFSSDKARADLGYEPRPARDALADALAWFRENGYLG